MSFHKGQEGLIPADQYQKLENTFWYGQSSKRPPDRTSFLPVRQ